MNLPGLNSVSPVEDWSFHSNMLNLGYDTVPMMASGIDSSVMTPSSIGATWDPMSEFDHDSVKPEGNSEPSMEWDVMRNES
jgi:hypothetical protein